MQPQYAKMLNMEKSSFDQLLMDVIREMGVLRPEQVLPGWALSLSEIYALNILAERAPLSQQDLGDALLLEKSSITRLVQQLEQRGWVMRERDARDNRLRLLRLTELGARMTEQMHQHMHERHAELFNQLLPEEQAALIQGLSALRQVLQNTPFQPHPPLEEQSGKRR
jgi:DNA-binding MarR family transcriptional regulator